MVEYTVDTLVHLYDSLNEQIDKLYEAITTSYKYACNPCDDRALKQIEDLRQSAEARLDKVITMRKNVETLIDRILKVEVKETE